MSNWLEWHGGECPIDPDTIVDVRFGDGSVDTDFAGCWDWGNMWSLDQLDITGYRVSKANSGPVLEPVDGEPEWFKVSPAARSIEHFASEVNPFAAAFIAESFRAHIDIGGEEPPTEDMFCIVMRLIRCRQIDAYVRLQGDRTEVRFAFTDRPYPGSGGRTVH